jgi:predicted nucleic acid-binding Zn ribbon protein
MNMPEKLLQHKHCRFCEKAIPLKDEFCGEECRVQHQAMMRKKRNQLYILMAVAMGLMLFTLLVGSA